METFCMKNMETYCMKNVKQTYGKYQLGSLGMDINVADLKKKLIY